MEIKKNAVGKREFIKKAVRFGNSAGVLLPKKFLGMEVKITILKKPLDIKKDALKILENYFPDLLGIYITSISEKNIEILAISTNIAKIIHLGKYKISLVPLNIVKKDIKENEKLKAKLKQAKIILNKALLFELEN